MIKKAFIVLSKFTAAFMAAVLISGLCISSYDAKAAAAIENKQSYPVAAVDRLAKRIKKADTLYSYKGNVPKSVKADEAEKSYTAWDENYTSDELRLMSGIIYCEAGNMSDEARIAVANVIINRANDTADWGHVSTIKEVIYDDYWGVQFSPTKGNPSSFDKAMDIYDHLEDYEGKWQYRQMMDSISSAKKAFCGEKTIPDSFMFFNSHISSSKEKCESKGKTYKIIDSHIYF